MAEEPTELRRIHWTECFAFTHVFRTFRMAMHPGKLGLALAGLLVIGLWGLILDGIWPEKCRPLTGEVEVFWQVADIDAWRTQVSEPRRLEGIRAAFASTKALGINPPTDLEEDLAAGRGEIAEVIEDGLDDLEDQYAKEVKRLKDEDGKREKVAALARQYTPVYRQLRALESQGIFGSFVRYEKSVVARMLGAGSHLNFLGSVDTVLDGRRAAAVTGMAGAEIGVLPCVVLALRGLQWMICEHWVFALLFLVDALAIAVLAGGAICRMAAINVALGEQVPVKTALMFAQRKFFSFVSAPLLPIALVLIIGVLLFLGGLFMSIPLLGDVLGGLGMVLALVGGFVMTLVVLGAIGGGSLMWPTIAVEGSDCFDAMSRCYSYVHTKPWRTALYAGVAVVYGALIYLFARFFVLVMLTLTRLFVGRGMGLADRPGTGVATANKIDAIWPHPTFAELTPAGLPFAMEGGDAVAAFLVCIWVGLVVALLGALLVSFYLTGSTIIYYLLRREVDATDLEDVYTEAGEEEEGVPTSWTPAAPSEPAAEMAAPAEVAPAEPEESTAPQAESAPPEPGPVSEEERRDESERPEEGGGEEQGREGDKPSEN